MEDQENKKDILVVEDNALQTFELNRMLERHGYTVLTAANGAEGLALAGEKLPSLIISDVVMPEMDGYQMCAEIKKDLRLKDIPVILLTQLTQVEEVIKGLQSGAEYFVSKPFDEDFLLSKVKDIFKDRTRFKNRPEDKGIEVAYGEGHYMVHAGHTQTMKFILSTYEGAVLQNKKLTEMEKELVAVNENLEKMVGDRTRALNEEVKRVKAAEEKLRTVTQSANDAIISIGPPDTVYLWNRKAEEIFGYTAAEAVGRPVHELIRPEKYRERAKKGLEAFFTSGTGPFIGKQVELVAMKKDSTEFPVELSLSTMRLDGEWRAVGIVRDISERKRAEEALKRHVEELERFKKATIQREIKMKELRDRLGKLEKDR